MDFETLPMFPFLSHRLPYVIAKFPPVTGDKWWSIVIFMSNQNSGAFIFIENFVQQNLFHCRLENKNLLSVACFLVVADFRHRAIAVLQPKPVQSPMNRVPAKNKCQIKVKANWN